MSTAILRSNGQITLPKDILDRLALKPGDRFRVAVKSEGILLLERDQSPRIDDAFGMLRHLARRKPVTITEMSEAIGRRATKKHAKRP